MEARRKRFEDLDISRDEINNIGKALQKEEFRKLFADYCEEVNSPESKELFQHEVTELEKQRGVDVTFINPEPGFVVKTSVDGSQKAFINICKNEKISRPSSSQASQEGTSGRQWSIPFSLAPPREDLDKQRNRCSVFDVVFHPEALMLAEKISDFRRMLIDTALDAVESNCHVSLDRVNLKFPKMVYKGLQQAAVIRKKIPHHQTSEGDQEFLNSIPYPPEDDTWTQLQKQKKHTDQKKAAQTEFTTPKYLIKYRHDIDMADYTNDATAGLNATVPKELVIQIELPLLKSTNNVMLDVTNKSLSLLSEKPKYKLDLILPYGVDEDAGRATFDTTSHTLSLVLPVKRSTSLCLDGGREDSGVESDLGTRPDEESDDKTHSENSDEGCDGNDIPFIHEMNPEEDATYQTNSLNKSNCDKLLKDDVQYLLPNFTCNAYESMIAFTLQVKNVEESSVCHQIILDGQGMQLSFCSLGGGLFPQHYGLCIVFPDGVCLEEGSLGLEVWDNNVVVQVKLKQWLQPVSELSVGTGVHDLQTQDFPNLAHVEKLLSDVQANCDIPQHCPAIVDILSVKPEEVILTVKPDSQNGEGSGERELSIDSSAESKSDEDSKKPSKTSMAMGRSPRTSNIRQLSECSSDDFNGMKIRGILKKRPIRSLSESNAEEYAWLHRSVSDDGESVGLSSALGSELCVADEGSEGGGETENDSGDRQNKKTVRFSDVIAQQTFRPNSSILGQRKKNQRKQRNKKRAQERRASESENSEPEPDVGKGRRRGSLTNESSDPEGKYNKNKFMKDTPVVPVGKPIAKAILRRAPSSDTDEDAVRENNFMSGDKTDHVVDNAIPNKTDTTCPIVVHGESSEDERDLKTEDNKKKKKRKGKKVAETDSQNQLPQKASCQKEPQFDSALILDLEI